MPISAQKNDLALADTMIKIHGAQAIREAEALLHHSASLGDREAAAKWLRVAALIEFTGLHSIPASSPDFLAA